MDSRRGAAFRLLGVPAGSDRATVARAYRRLALMIHPDVSADPEAGHRFAALTAAYRVAREVPGLDAEGLDAEPGPAPRPEGQRPAPAQPGTRGGPAASGWVWVGEPRWAATRPSGAPAHPWPRPPIVAGPVHVRPSTGGAAEEARDG